MHDDMVSSININSGHDVYLELSRMIMALLDIQLYKDNRECKVEFDIDGTEDIVLLKKFIKGVFKNG